MYLIGLTGNIASGKSTVRRMLAELGARTIDADALSHAVLLPGTPAWRSVVDAFGLDVVEPDGTIDRQKLGAIVFANPERLKKLESIVHPALRTQLGLLLRDLRDEVVVIEAVKLIEGGLSRLCDATWVVTTTPAEAERRLMQDRGMNAENARLRLAAQPPLENKLAQAQVVIDNSGSIESTRLQVMHAFVQARTDKATDKRPVINQLLGLAPGPAVAPVAAPPPRADAASPQTASQKPPATTLPPAAIPVAPATAPKPAAQKTAGPKPVAPKPAETMADGPKTAHPTPPSTAPPPRGPRSAPPAARSSTPGAAPAASQPVPRPAAPVQPHPAPVAAPRVRTPEEEQQLRALAARIKVRRARPNDSALLGKILAASEGKKTPLSRAEVLQRFGKWGFWLAEADGQVWAMASWRAENLVAVLRDLWVRHPDLGPYVLPRLFQAIEQEANALVCEVIALIANPTSEAAARSAAQAAGFGVRRLESLHPVWRSVAKSELRERDVLYIKQLRERMITSPI